MKNFIGRLINLLMIAGTLLGILLLTLPDYRYKTECLFGMLIGYLFITGLNYLFLSRVTVWNSSK
jgi:hypothetical protein